MLCGALSASKGVNMHRVRSSAQYLVVPASSLLKGEFYGGRKNLLKTGWFLRPSRSFFRVVVRDFRHWRKFQKPTPA